MKIFIKKNTRSYSPEIYAYKNYLDTKGFNTTIGLEPENINFDLIILLMGFYPTYKVKKFKGVKVIHEYSSLSLYPLAKIKNYIKYKFNSKPDARIFNSELINNGFGFNDNIAHIFRETGVDSSFFVKLNCAKEYDFVYTGSTGPVRKGLTNVIKKILMLGFSILVIGKISDEFYNNFKQFNKIHFTGEQKRKDLPNLYQKAIYGLNFTPDVFPLNQQYSTKTIEYLASGLKVVSNKYLWMEKFMNKENCNFFWLHNLQDRKNLENFKFYLPNLWHLEWNNILTRINFEYFIKEII